MTDLEKTNMPEPLPTTEKKMAKKPKPMKAAAAAPKKAQTKRATLTDDQKREARNVALREWRKKNKERYSAYIRQWRANRQKQEPKKLASPKKKTQSA